METKIRIFDGRRKQFFQMDDEYLNGYAKLCGWKSTLVYLALCRHAGKNQSCFPSIKTIATKLAVSRDVVIDGINTLKEWNIIQVKRRKDEKGSWQNNFYYLVDKSDWNPKPQVADSD